MKIVAFAGLAGAGKDTAAAVLIEQGWTRLAFGDVLKDVVATMFSIDRAWLEGDTPGRRLWREEILPFWDQRLNDELDLDITPRELLKLIGAHIRKLHPGIWTLAVEACLDKLPADAKVVLTDLRHVNEWQMLKRKGAICIGVRRGKPPVWLAPLYKNMSILYPEGASFLDPFRIEEARTYVNHAKTCLDHKVHESEWQHTLLPLDYVIHNRGSIRKLHKTVLELVS